MFPLAGIKQLVSKFTKGQPCPTSSGPDPFTLSLRVKGRQRQTKSAHSHYFVFAGNSGKLSVSLPSLLKYVTGLSSIPPTGLKQPIELLYLPDNEKAIFPKSQACFAKLMLPTLYHGKQEFFSAFIKALEFGGGYGNA